jgi:hypothetical protein
VKRLILAVGAVLMCCWGFAAPVSAHGANDLAFQGVSGPYLVSFFDGRTTGIAGEAEYRLVLTADPGDGKLGEEAPAAPVPRAVVEVTDSSGRTHRADGIGNVYSAVLEDRTQRLEVMIDAPAGKTALSVNVHRLPTSPPRSTSRRPILAAAVLGGSVLMALTGWVAIRRRRVSTAASATASVLS